MYDTESLDGETWKDIPGLSGKYQASNMGRVRSVDRYITCVRRVKGRVLMPWVSNSGHCTVFVGSHKNRKENLAKIIYETYKGHVCKDCEVVHKNGRKFDNRPENLEVRQWGKSEVGRNQYSAPLKPFSQAQVTRIFDMYHKAGLTQLQIAKSYGVAVDHIRAILNRGYVDHEHGAFKNIDV